MKRTNRRGIAGVAQRTLAQLQTVLDGTYAPVSGATAPYQTQIFVPTIGGEKAHVGWTSSNWSILSTRFLNYDRFTTDADANYIEWDLAILAGTWQIVLLGQTGVGHGKLDVSLDGTTVGTSNRYSSPAVQAVRTSMTGITVASSGVKTLRLQTNGKDDLSSGYIANIQAVILTRTGA